MLGDKILDLRKKQGWSQEELSEKLDVSRQSISKWESGQSIPDLERIILLSQIFNVSIDELVTESEGPLSDPTQEETPRKLLTAQAFADLREEKKKAARYRAFGFFLLIISVVPLIVLSGAMEVGRLSENQVALFGLGFFALALLLSLIGLSSAKHMKRMMEAKLEAPLQLMHGLENELRAEWKAIARRNLYWKNGGYILIGIVICLNIFFSTVQPGPFYENLRVGICLFFIALVAALHFYGEEEQALFETLLFSKKAQKMAGFASAYWLFIVFLYLGISFLTQRWDITWLIWILAVAFERFFQHLEK